MEALGLNPGFLLAQLFNFGLFFLIMSVGAWKPLMNMLDARRERIARGLEDARIAEEARTNAEAEARKIIDRARAEAQQIVAEARASAEERARPIVQAAEQEAEGIRREAQERASEARNEALADMRSQVASLAMAAARRLVGSADEKAQERLVTDFFTTSQREIAGLQGDLVVTTALPLNDSEQKKLAKQLGGNVAEWRVDPTILGGVIVRSGDRVIDGSVRSNLNQMAASLS